MSPYWDKGRIDKIVDDEGSWKKYVYGWLFFMMLAAVQYFLGYALLLEKRPLGVNIVTSLDGRDFIAAIIIQIIVFTIFLLLPSLIAWRVEKSFEDTKEK